jgi:sodium-coupled neutral amino acid transporter 11
MDHLFPSLEDMPFLWLLTNRKAMMILLILGISYPLSLYRDISKAITPISPKQHPS